MSFMSWTLSAAVLRKSVLELSVVAEHVYLRRVRNMRKATTSFVMIVSSSVYAP
jgi:hypothetical protein